MGHSPATLSRASLFMACVNFTIRLSFRIFGPTPALILSKSLKTHLYSAWMAEPLLPAIEILRQILQANGVPCQSYSAHSFHKGAAQHASDNDMLDKHIQKLGRWSSQVFQLYFKASTASLYSLNLRFQTGRPPAVNNFPTPAIRFA